MSDIPADASRPRCETCREAQTRGIVCFHCKGERLDTTHTVRPCAGLIVRYKRCLVCSTRFKTEERLVWTH